MLRIAIAGFCAVLLQAQTSTNDAVIFQSKVNLVPVPVVVRDKKAHAVGDLTKDDFQIFDNGKAQAITRFSLEKSGVAEDRVPISATPGKSEAASAAPTNVIPDRFVGYVFDDLHFNIQDLMNAKIAALKHFDAENVPGTRAAVFTTSGIDQEDFTSDRERLKAALNRLSPRSKAPSPQTDCPYITYYAANLIDQMNDSQALQAAAKSAMDCPAPPRSMQDALNLARRKAFQAASIGETETRITLSSLRNMVRRMGAAPGQRTLVMVSPGFIFPSHEQDVSQLIDLAVRTNVVINAIDGRGLYVDARYDATRSSVNNAMSAYESSQATESGQTLSLVAEGTGGTAFLNNNDLLEGFRRTSSPPEFTYVLGFSPDNLKIDGKFHTLKVKLKNVSGLTVQARKGYFAPRQAVGPADEVRQEIDDALFSRQETKDFPLAIVPQVTKNPNQTSKVTIVVQVGLKGFRFSKSDGVNKNQLTLVVGLFDKNGNYVSGTQSNVDMHYKDETLEARLNAGLAVKTNFEDVKPGSYLVRLVARESEGQTMSTVNGEVEVP
jgi:VWFA-related protein